MGLLQRKQRQEKKENDRWVGVGIADFHAGHKLGLCNPETILWEEGPEGEPVARYPGLGPFQERLWGMNLEMIASVKDFADGDETTIFYVGDLTHGNRYIEELMAVTPDDQMQIGYWSLKPWLELPNVNVSRLFQGTYVHTFGGSSEAIVTRQLRGDFPKCDIKTVAHGRITVGGVTLDVTHHGPSTGSRRWLEGNNPRFYLRDLQQKEFALGNEPPQVVMRAHRHTWIPEERLRVWWQGKTYESAMILLPSMCGLSAHGRQVMQAPFILTLGCVCVEVVNGQVGRILPLVKMLDIRTKEVICE